MKGYNNKSRVETLTFLEDWKIEVMILERESGSSWVRKWRMREMGSKLMLYAWVYGQKEFMAWTPFVWSGTLNQGVGWFVDAP